MKVELGTVVTFGEEDIELARRERKVCFAMRLHAPGCVEVEFSRDCIVTYEESEKIARAVWEILGGQR